MWLWCQDIHFIWTQCNQLCDQEHWYTYIWHNWHMPLIKFVWLHKYVPLHFYCNLHSRPHITEHIHQKSVNCNFITIILQNISQQTNMPSKCQKYAICPNYSMCIYGGSYPNIIPHSRLLALIMLPESLYSDDNNNSNNDDDDITAQLHIPSWPPGQISQKPLSYKNSQNISQPFLMKMH